MDPPDRMTGFSDIGRRIGRAYTLALCLVGLLSIGAFLALDSFIARQGEAASIINVAGKQRMLSQRITALSQWVVPMRSGRTGCSCGRPSTTWRRLTTA